MIDFDDPTNSLGFVNKAKNFIRRSLDKEYLDTVTTFYVKMHIPENQVIIAVPEVAQTKVNSGLIAF